MGPDFVELAMAWEDAFDVKIDNATWERLATPGQLIAHLTAVLPPGESACTSERALTAVRRVRAAMSRAMMLDNVSLDAHFVTDLQID